MTKREPGANGCGANGVSKHSADVVELDCHAHPTDGEGEARCGGGCSGDHVCDDRGCGGHDDLAGLDGEAAGFDVVVSPAPAEIGELADACVRYVEQVVGVRLDYGAETLPLLDHYLEMRRPELKSRPEAMRLIVRAAGAYFGEVARRRIGAFWRTDDHDLLEWDLCAEPVYLSFNPFAVAYDAVHHGDEAGPTSHFELDDEDREAVETRLLELPALPEEEFYLLSTRLEVLDIAVDTVKARMVSAGLGDVAFGPQDYPSGL